MKNIPKFAELIFKCPSCKMEQKLEVVGKIEDKHNHN